MTAADEAPAEECHAQSAVADSAESDPESLVLARAELHRLAAAWRTLLTMHERDDDGRCRACPGLIRRRRWPCHIWLIAHRHLIDDLPARAHDRHPPRWRITTRRGTLPR